jgi:hypothetical protein
VNRKKGSDATVDMSEIKSGDPVKTFIIQVAAPVVGGYAGSGDYRRNPEFSEYRVSQCRRSGAFAYEEVGRNVSDQARTDEEIHALCEALIALERRSDP